MNRERGFSLTELLVAMVLVSMMVVSTLGMVIRGQDIAMRAESRSMVQTNVRFAVERLERDLRMTGFGVPTGAEVGGSTSWLPYIFNASPTTIGFRTDIDGSWTSVICTPKTSNVNCPRNEVYSDTIAYYSALSCKKPDDATANMPVVLVMDGSAWSSATCSGVDTPNKHLILTANLTDNTFTAGRSNVATIEQVYYRYTASAQPPYGRLERYTRYANAPDNTFPPTSVTWTLVADQLTDFWLVYRNAAGTALSGNPLTAAQRAQVDSISIFLEGYDSVGPQGIEQVYQAESRVLIRNPAT